MDIQPKEIESNDLKHSAGLSTALNVLRMIVAETMDYPPSRPYSTDSYLPPHLITAAQDALTYFELEVQASRMIALSKIDTKKEKTCTPLAPR